MEQVPLIPEVLNGEQAPNGGNGRPRGAKNLKHKALERAARSEALPIVQKLCKLALEGDTLAARIILDRIWPRPRTAPISINLPETRNPAELRAAMHELLSRVARGEVAPDEGQAIVGIMRDVLDSHRIQTLDVGVAAEAAEVNTRELLVTKLTKAIAERQALTIAPPESENGQ